MLHTKRGPTKSPLPHLKIIYCRNYKQYLTYTVLTVHIFTYRKLNLLFLLQRIPKTNSECTLRCSCLDFLASYATIQLSWHLSSYTSIWWLQNKAKSSVEMKRWSVWPCSNVDVMVSYKFYAPKNQFLVSGAHNLYTSLEISFISSRAPEEPLEEKILHADHNQVTCGCKFITVAKI